MSSKIKASGIVKILEIHTDDLHPHTRHFLEYETDAILTSTTSPDKLYPAGLTGNVSELIQEDLEQIADLCTRKGAEYFKIIA